MKLKSRRLGLFVLLATNFSLIEPVQGLAGGCPATRSDTMSSESDQSPVATPKPEPTPVRVAGPFNVPWSVAFLPNGSFVVTERPGHLRHVWPAGQSFEVIGIPKVLYSGHGGLLDVAVDTDYAETGEIYFTYLGGEESASVVRVVKAKLDEQSETLSDLNVIFESKPGPRTEMLGGRIALTGDGYLFLSLGDRWQRDLAQDLSEDEGKVIRIRTDGSIPDDNPFVKTPGALPEIWSYGHRNPEGLAFDRASGELWEHEHGPQGGDELNVVERGQNYGWPTITYGVDYSGRPIGAGTAQDGMEQPINYWAPFSIAPSGLAITTKEGDQLAWIGALAGQMLDELTVQDHCVVSETHYFKDTLGRVRDVRADKNGKIYILTDGGEGMLYRVDTVPDEVELGLRSRP